MYGKICERFNYAFQNFIYRDGSNKRNTDLDSVGVIPDRPFFYDRCMQEAKGAKAVRSEFKFTKPKVPFVIRMEILPNEWEDYQNSLEVAGFTFRKPENTYILPPLPPQRQEIEAFNAKHAAKTSQKLISPPQFFETTGGQPDLEYQNLQTDFATKGKRSRTVSYCLISMSLPTN